MNNRILVSSSLLSAVLTALLAAYVGAQSPSPTSASQSGHPVKTAARTWTAPRTPDGQPDLQGIWSNATVTPLERPRELGDKQFFTEREAAEYAKQMVQRNNADNRLEDAEADVALAYNDTWYDRGNKVIPTLRTSLIVDPPNGRIPPLTPEAQKRVAARDQIRRSRGPADSYEDRALRERCITLGAPRLPGPYNNNIQIVQSPGYVAILHEMIHEVRLIRLDPGPHVGTGIRQWMGDSRGHWEGNTLVVDTTNYNDQVASYNCCGGAGANLHLVERFTRIGPGSIDYQYTVEDPATFTKPWTVAVPLTASPGPIYEYSCHEGNYGLAHMLIGTRAQEKAAEETKNKISSR
jgi:hypothetical protein